MNSGKFIANLIFKNGTFVEANIIDKARYLGHEALFYLPDSVLWGGTTWVGYHLWNCWYAWISSPDSE